MILLNEIKIGYFPLIRNTYINIDKASALTILETNVGPALRATGHDKPTNSRLQLEAGVAIVLVVVVGLKPEEAKVVIVTMAPWRMALFVLSVAYVAVCGGDEAAGSTNQQRARLLVSKQVRR